MSTEVYRKHGNRISLLPLTQRCGMAGRLAALYGAGRPAAMSSAFHAREAGAANAQELLARLSDDELEEVNSWRSPADVEVDGVTLSYAAAEKEIALGLDDLGMYVDPTTGEECLTIGHMDFGWVAGPLAYVADIKKTLWTTADGPDSTQLHAYAWAFAQKHGCTHYCTGLWIATEGEWLWSTEIVELSSPRGQQIWERIYAAASNVAEEYNVGAHCRHCYARLHCQEHVLPAALLDTWLAPVAEGMLFHSDEEATACLLKIQATEDVLKQAKRNLEELVRRGEVRIEQDGLAWGPVDMPGRASLDKEKLIAEVGDADRFMRRGKPYLQFRWLKKAG